MRSNPASAEYFRERLEVVPVLVRLEQVGRLGTGAGVGQEVLEPRRVLRPPAPGLAPAGEKVTIVRCIRGDALLEIGDGDAQRAARRQNTPQLGQEEFHIPREEQVLEHVRREDATRAALGQGQTPQHVDRERCGMNVDVDPARQMSGAATDMQLQVLRGGADAERCQLLLNPGAPNRQQFIAKPVERGKGRHQATLETDPSPVRHGQLAHLGSEPEHVAGEIVDAARELAQVIAGELRRVRGHAVAGFRRACRDEHAAARQIVDDLSCALAIIGRQLRDRRVQVCGSGKPADPADQQRLIGLERRQRARRRMHQDPAVAETDQRIGGKNQHRVHGATTGDRHASSSQ